MRVFARIVAVALMSAGPLLAGGVASAAPPQTFTETVKDFTETFVDVVPMCDEGGPPYEITVTYNAVFHSTLFDDGREHSTGTITGTFQATPVDDPSLPDASGRFTQWFGFNVNNQVVNGTFTFSVRGQFEDGSPINFHLTDHFNTTPTGAEFFFTHCHD